ncbi:MAG TPA: CBS domain-containing protein [Desulfatiglandales bacterium]|nr:CBS domain-containing protein [Desulfatiglandales bacterium]
MSTGIYGDQGRAARKAMKLEEIMTTQVATIGMDDTLAAIRKIFEKVHFHHLLVLSEEHEVVGVISDRDLLKQLSPYLNTASEQKRDLHTLNKKAHQIMSRKLISASPTTTVKDAATLLMKHSISCLPVLAEDKWLVGIVTWKDILKFFLQSLGSAAPGSRAPGA